MDIAGIIIGSSSVVTLVLMFIYADELGNGNVGGEDRKER